MSIFATSAAGWPRLRELCWAFHATKLPPTAAFLLRTGGRIRPPSMDNRSRSTHQLAAGREAQAGLPAGAVARHDELAAVAPLSPSTPPTGPGRAGRQP